MNLSSKHCIPCETKIPPFTREQAEEYLTQVPNWNLDLSSDEFKINRTWKFKDFKEAMIFVNKVAELAEHEGHHPDIAIHYNQVTLTLWTHFIGGLFENDFIVAAKINEISI